MSFIPNVDKLSRFYNGSFPVVGSFYRMPRILVNGPCANVYIFTHKHKKSRICQVIATCGDKVLVRVWEYKGTDSFWFLGYFIKPREALLDKSWELQQSQDVVAFFNLRRG